MLQCDCESHFFRFGRGSGPSSAKVRLRNVCEGIHDARMVIVIRRESSTAIYMLQEF